MMTERNQSLSEQELLHMSNLTADETGIKDVVIWVGYDSQWIKVSNVPNSLDGKDCFTITIPDYKVIGTVNTQFITPDTIKDIISFAELNMKIISQYADYEISTAVLISHIRKLSERG